MQQNKRVEAPPGMIHPHDPRKLLWDRWMVVAVAYCVLSAAAELFIDSEAAGIWALLEIVVDLMYGVDMILTFRTGLLPPARLIDLGEDRAGMCWEREEIAERYYRSWFWPDLLSTIPFDRLVGDQQGSLRSLKAIRALKLARLIRVAQLAKLMQQAYKADSQQQWEVPLMDMGAGDDEIETGRTGSIGLRPGSAL